MYPYRPLEYSLTYVSGPTSEPVTLAECKLQCAIDSDITKWDVDLMAKAKAARREAESVLGKKIGIQVWTLTLGYWPNWNWMIPIQPLRTITKIEYTDLDGDKLTVDTDVYTFNAANNRLWLRTNQTWPEGVVLSDYAGVEITLTVGIDPVPEEIRQAILLRVGTLHNVREDMTLGTTLQAAKTGAFEALLGVEKNISI